MSVPEIGGELKLWKNNFNYIEIKPDIGDLILINPSYYHSVKTFPKGKRYSIQTFIIKEKKSNDLY